MQKRIAHITDTHLDDPTALSRGIDPRKNIIAVLEDVAAGKIDDIVFTGDIGKAESYQWLFEKLEQYKPGFKAILGNHDDVEQALHYYKNTVSEGEGELYYSQEDEYYKYIYLDSSSSVISERQMLWLENQIYTLKKIIVFIHHPVLGFPTGMDSTYPLQNRDALNQLLQQSKHNVSLFCGHYHMPDVRSDKKIKQYITPSTSFQVKKDAPDIVINTSSFGYRIITITENAVQAKLVTNRYDYFSPANR